MPCICDFPVTTNPVNTGEGKLNPEETLWNNFPNHRTLAKLGAAKLQLEPNGRTVTKAPASASGYYDAILAFQANGKAPVVGIDGCLVRLGAWTSCSISHTFSTAACYLPDEVIRSLFALLLAGHPGTRASGVERLDPCVRARKLCR